MFYKRIKPEKYWSGGTPPPPALGKDQYFRFFLLKASLRVCVEAHTLSQKFSPKHR